MFFLVLDKSLLVQIYHILRLHGLKFLVFYHHVSNGFEGYGHMAFHRLDGNPENLRDFFILEPIQSTHLEDLTGLFGNLVQDFLYLPGIHFPLFLIYNFLFNTWTDIIFVLQSLMKGLFQPLVRNRLHEFVFDHYIEVWPWLFDLMDTLVGMP